MENQEVQEVIDNFVIKNSANLKELVMRIQNYMMP